MAIALPFALVRGCKAKPEPAVVHQAAVTQTLGGTAALSIERVNPPIGPWTLVRHGSYCYRAVVRDTGKVIWAEAYVSRWTVGMVILGGDEPVYRYRYWGETKVLGQTFYHAIDR